jgi:hypothetical protein
VHLIWMEANNDVGKTAAFCSDSVSKWRATIDEDGHYSFAAAL